MACMCRAPLGTISIIRGILKLIARRIHKKCMEAATAADAKSNPDARRYVKTEFDRLGRDGACNMM